MCVCVCVHVCVCVYMYVCVCMCVYIYVCMCLCMYVLRLYRDDPAAKGKGGRGGSAQPSGKATLGSQFRSQLVGLVKNLKLTEPHFIRCVKVSESEVGW